MCVCKRARVFVYVCALARKGIDVRVSVLKNMWLYVFCGVCIGISLGDPYT